MKDDEYVFIGDNIYKFRSYAEIVKYVSPIGNNDVPYPYAIDKLGNYYLMVEYVVFKNIPSNMKNDPYDYYYNIDQITSDIGIIPPKQPVIQNFQKIDKFFIGKSQYTLRYKIDAASDYDRISKFDNFGDGMTLLLTDGTKIKLNKAKYIKLMKDYGKAIGQIKPFKNKKILQKRF